MAQPGRPFATIPTLFQRVHDELSAIQEITAVLGSLPDHETRMRVIHWVTERFSRAAIETAPAHPEPIAAPAPHDTQTLVDAESLRIPDADDLFEPVVETCEPPDLQGVFLSPAETTQPVFELVPPPERQAAVEPEIDEPRRPEPRETEQLDLLAHAEKVEPPAVPAPAVPLAIADRDLGAPAPPPAVRPTLNSTPLSTPRPQREQPPSESMEAMLESLVADLRKIAEDCGNT